MNCFAQLSFSYKPIPLLVISVFYVTLIMSDAFCKSDFLLRLKGWTADFVHTGGLAARDLTVKSNLKGMGEFANVFFNLPFQLQTVTHQTYRLTRTADQILKYRWADTAKGGKELKFLLPNLPELPHSSEVQSWGGGSRRVLI